jgi:hypothetical protein
MKSALISQDEAAGPVEATTESKEKKTYDNNERRENQRIDDYSGPVHLLPMMYSPKNTFENEKCPVRNLVHQPQKFPA